MINNVVLGGRIVQAEEEATPRGVPVLALRLLVERCSWDGEYREQCEVTARLYGEARVRGLAQYLEAGRHVAVTGHVCEGDPGLQVVIDRLEFLPHDCRARPLWVDLAQAA